MALVEAMKSGGTSRAQTFFTAYGLAKTFNAPNKGWGVEKRINEALAQAEREGRWNEVVEAGLRSYDLTNLISEGTSREMSSTNPSKGATGRLFISHASADKALADALADLLRLGTGLSHDRILCTSLDGMGIPIGTDDYMGYLNGQLVDAAMVLPLFTPAFFDSEVCLVEIGAMWGLHLAKFPLIFPPVDYARVERVLGKVQAASIKNLSALSELHDRIVDVFELKANTAMWNAKRAQFDERLPELIKSLAPSSRVPAEDLKAARNELAEANEEVAGLRAENAALQERVAMVVAAKTREMLDEAGRPAGPEMEQFTSAIKAAQDAMSPFSRGVREAVYEHLGRDTGYLPEPHSSGADDCIAGEREDLLFFDDEGGYYPNISDPGMAAALQALEEVFSKSWGEEIAAWFEKTYGKRFRISVRPAWEALDLL